MNKKGLTLIELIAVIAILGILAVIVGPALLSIRSMVMVNSLDSKIGMIKAAALEYASDHVMEIVPVTSDVSSRACNYACYKGKANAEKVEEELNVLKNKPGSDVPSNLTCNCELIGTHILVKNLINQGYLAGDSDEKDVLLNPLSSEPLNFSQVFITYDSSNAMTRSLVAYIKDEQSLCPKDEVSECEDVWQKKDDEEVKY